VVGHVNNAALWLPMVEIADGPIAAASMIHHRAVQGGDEVELCHRPGRLWLLVEGQVAVSASFAGP